MKKAELDGAELYEDENGYYLKQYGHVQEVSEFVRYGNIVYAVTKAPKKSGFGEGYLEGTAFNTTEGFTEIGSNYRKGSQRISPEEAFQSIGGGSEDLTYEDVQ